MTLKLLQTQGRLSAVKHYMDGQHYACDFVISPTGRNSTDWSIVTPFKVDLSNGHDTIVIVGAMKNNTLLPAAIANLSTGEKYAIIFAWEILFRDDAGFFAMFKDKAYVKTEVEAALDAAISKHFGR